jgi:hypothetical protein
VKLKGGTFVIVFRAVFTAAGDVICSRGGKSGGLLLSGLDRTAIPKQRREANKSARALFETVLPQDDDVGCLISRYRGTRKTASRENSKDSAARVRKRCQCLVNALTGHVRLRDFTEAAAGLAPSDGSFATSADSPLSAIGGKSQKIGHPFLAILTGLKRFPREYVPLRGNSDA